ncbi:phosphate transport system regulatory protein PhoU [Thalassobacillus devorans]|uniref:Phosphate-specific transport system accessory protein PhoU n=1 Tax=Thalassobacillus devorans TaxID=279813 RepID=A0ABQ1P6F6_9BACI|nr:phosphate signaling complex protein PhoU [Thalassobacillus devorans]NIK29655.1 phosphate transport system protein [Thalassobacillus devorans]GGC91791.1 phosphate transport system regulatory protein PhoU [Thalassobacillus devorans]
MPTRGHFSEELKDLKADIRTLAEDTKHALQKAITALHNSDVKQAHQIIEEDKRIDKKEEEINERVMILIAKQQPVATDLRRLIIAIKITTDLERMADHAKNISKATIHLGEDHPISIHPSIKEMAEVAFDMVDIANKAYEHEDISFAHKLSEMDDIVDKKYGEMIKELLELTANNPDQIQYLMQMAFSARYIERFADHITNIGEEIFFLIKGRSYDLNE